MNSTYIPDLRDVVMAEKVLRTHFPPSPVISLGHDVTPFAVTLLKLENFLPTGSFKIRGATYLISQLSESERKAGVIAASTGNFSQGVSWASQEYGIKAKIVMPEGSNPKKIMATRALGGEVIFHGSKFDDARKHAEKLASENGYRYIHSANEPHLVTGVGTHTLELLTDHPEVDTVIVPVGGGSGAGGASVVAKSFSPKIRVIGVQSERSRAAYSSWVSGKDETSPNETYAEGLATGESYSYTQEIMRKYLDDFILVTDSQIRDAWKIIAKKARIIPESASASALAAELVLKKELEGRCVGLIITGGNSPETELESLLQ